MKRRGVFLIFVLMGIFVFPLISSATYYVSNSGNDSNNGSLGYPWKTIDMVNNQTFNPGDQILFKRGDTWRETLTIPSSGNSTDLLNFSFYGSGDNPKFLGSENVTGWTLVSGNVWKSNNTFEDPSLTYDGALWIEHSNGTILWGNAEKANISDLSFEYDWYWNSSDNKTYLYSSNNPSSIYPLVEIAQRVQNIYVGDKEYLNIDNLKLIYSTGFGIKTEWAGTDNNLNGLFIGNCEISHTGIKEGTEGYGISFYHSDSIIKNNIIHDTGRRGISLYTDSGRTVNISNITIENNEFYDGFHVTGVDFSSNGNHWMSNITIRNNYIHDDPEKNLSKPEIYDSSALSFIGYSPSNWSNISVYNNIITGQGTNHIFLSNAQQLSIHNNVFYRVNNNFDTLYAMIYMNADEDVDIKNNVFYNDGLDDGSPHFYAIRTGTGNKTNIDIDYNLYYMSNDSWFLQYNSTSYRMSQFSTYQSVSGWDANSPNPENPLFIDAPNNNFSLYSESPGVGNGVDLTEYIADYDNVSVSSPPNIGAFETTYNSLSVSLNKPADNNYSSGSSMTFEFKASDLLGVDSIGLFGNFSGNWTANYTNTSYVNNTWLNITVAGFSENYYVWSVWANDSDGNSLWSINRTFTIDRTAPIITVFSPIGSPDYEDSDDVIFNISTNEPCTCQYSVEGGSNGTMSANSTNTGFTDTDSFSEKSGDYDVDFYCFDYSGNMVLNLTSFEVPITSDDDDDSSSSSSSSSSSTTTTEEEEEENESEEEEIQTFTATEDKANASLTAKENLSSKIKFKNPFFKNIRNSMVDNSLFSVEINLKKLEPNNSSEIVVNYTIKDLEGNIYFEGSEVTNLEEMKSYYRDFDVGNLTKGKYILEAQIENAGEIETIQSQFKVRPNLPFTVALIFGLIVIGLVVFFFLYGKFVQVRKNKKYLLFTKR